MDQRSGDGWFSGWSEIFAFYKRNSRSRLLSCSTREMLQHWTRSSRIPASRKGSVWRKWKLTKRAFPSRKTDRLLDLRVLPGHWSQRFCRELCRPIYTCSSKWWYSGVRYKMRRNSIVDDTNPIWWHLGKRVQIKKTRVWETQGRIGIVQYRDSQKKAGPDYHRLRTMVKRSIEQNLRMKNFEARNGNFETSAVVKNHRVKQREQRSLGDCLQWKANG